MWQSRLIAGLLAVAALNGQQAVRSEELPPPPPSASTNAADAQPWYADPASGDATLQSVSYLQAQGGAQPAAPNAAGQQPQPQSRLTPPTQSRNPFANRGNAQNSSPYLARLSRAPDMYGDFFQPVGVSLDLARYINSGLPTGEIGSGIDSVLEGQVPLGGGMRRFKNEQTRALPTDRVFATYNHFHNAVELKSFDPTTGGVQSDASHIDQYTIGVEKTFDDGNWSLELRMPFSGGADASVPSFQFNSDGVGNLSLTLKRLLYIDESLAVAAGIATTAPTGSNANIFIPILQTRITVENDSVHLLPYIAAQFTPDENWFFHSFAQIDVAANPNGISLSVPGAPTRGGSLSEQTLMYLDASAGYWWFRSDDDEGLTGLASILEVHYTTTLNDAQQNDLGTNGFFNAGNGQNRFDVVNLTVGAHSEWWQHTSVRAAVVVPLRSENNRFFDSEFQLSLIRRF